jgi:type IV pilus assembly protein PilB
MHERPTHLHPVPAPGADRAEPTIPGGQAGLTPPLTRERARGFLTDVIVELGFLSREQVDRAIDEARTAGRTPERLMVERKMIDADKLSRAVAERYGLDHVNLAEFHVDMGAANLVPAGMARRYKAVPVAYVNDHTLLLAVADPANVLAVDDIRIATGMACRVAVAADDDIDALVSRLSTLESAVTEAFEEGEDELTDVSELRESADDAPVVKLVYSILGQAVNEGASDVHFQPDDNELRVRFRVDGVLYEAARVPRRMVSGVVSRVKIMANLDIAEKRVPQDGRVTVNVDDRAVDLRVVTLPTQDGEGCTIRILDKRQALRSLDELGMDPEAEAAFEHAFRQPYGAVLVTGPTGSGKSTTLYAALNELNESERNIITVEDPVEYQLSGVNQINVNPRAGLTFANGLRSILRADPDVIMVGEIRDAETARIAIEAALTGHMVLSTLHTNDAPGAIVRLMKMGIESFLTSSAIDCVVAQRLARTLCPACKRRTIAPQAALEEAGFRVGTDLEVYEPVGCGRCNGTGYRGRTALYSVMVLSEAIKEMIIEGSSEAELAAVAHTEGMQTIREAGLEKIRAGITSVEEVARVAV